MEETEKQRCWAILSSTVQRTGILLLNKMKALGRGGKVQEEWWDSLHLCHCETVQNLGLCFSEISSPPLRSFLCAGHNQWCQRGLPPATGAHAGARRYLRSVTSSPDTFPHVRGPGTPGVTGKATRKTWLVPSPPSLGARPLAPASPAQQTRQGTNSARTFLCHRHELLPTPSPFSSCRWRRGKPPEAAERRRWSPHPGFPRAGSQPLEGGTVTHNAGRNPPLSGAVGKPRWWAPEVLGAQHPPLHPPLLGRPQRGSRRGSGD